METTTLLNRQIDMRTQVARSKGTEWMVTSYNAWQQRSPLDNMPKKNPSSILRVVSRLSQKESQIHGLIALSFKSILLILGIILSVKSR